MPYLCRSGGSELATVVVSELARRHPSLKARVMGTDAEAWLRSRSEFEMKNVGAGQYMLSLPSNGRRA